MWAGFLSWPLVKQTSKVGRQRHSLVLTASFTSSTASSTSAFSKFIGPGITLCISSPLRLYLINHQGIVMVNLLASYGDTTSTKSVSLYKQKDTRQEAVDPAVGFIWASELLRCRPGHELQWDSAGQNAQVPKQQRYRAPARNVIHKEFGSSFMASRVVF